MSRKEPYIGMPIMLGEYEEVTAPMAAVPVAADSDCDVEIKPNPNPMPDTKPDIDLPIAMAYVPWQRWQQPYELEKGFEVGTIFPELNLPFKGYRGGVK